MQQLKEFGRWIMAVVALVVLTALGGLSMAADSYYMRAAVEHRENGSLARKPLPPELQALIGLKIPPEMKPVNVRNNTSGEIEIRERLTLGAIPGFHAISSGEVNIGFIGQTPVFVVLKRTPTLEREILNIEIIPSEYLNVRLVDGKIQWRAERYDVTGVCKQIASVNAKNRYDAIVALSKPENGKEECEHTTRQVKLAWGVDKRTGWIEVIAPETVECLLPSPIFCK